MKIKHRKEFEEQKQRELYSDSKGYDLYRPPKQRHDETSKIVLFMNINSLCCRPSRIVQKRESRMPINAIWMKKKPEISFQKRFPLNL